MEAEILYRDLEAGAEMIRALLQSITQEEAGFRPEPGDWSMLEVVCHLLDEEREDFRVRLEITLFRPQDPWPPIDPPGWVSVRHYREQELSETLSRFVAERAKSLAWLRGLVEPDWDAPYETPWGEMTAGDLLASWVAHDNLHMRQLIELRRARIGRLSQPYEVDYAGEW